MAGEMLGAVLDPKGRKADARAFRAIHHVVLVAGLCAVATTTVPNAYMTPLVDAVLLISALFALEWLLRLLAAPTLSVPPGRTDARRRYLFSFLGWIDLLAGFGVPAGLLWGLPPEIACTAGMLWVLKLARYVSDFDLIVRVLHNERKALLSVLAAFGIALLLAGAAEYLLERTAQPITFGTLPAALWWCIVTLTTAGYGDAIPVTVVGRMVAGLVMVLGITISALSAGILASGFATELRRRDFLHNWNLVAKVPLFRALGAGVIAEVAHLLRPLRLPAGTLLMRRGEPGESMYFIVKGEVEVQIPPSPVRLGDGAFLGEMALITGEPRTANVITRRATQFLSLDIADFRALAGQHPELTQAIEAEADRRRSQFAAAG